MRTSTKRTSPSTKGNESEYESNALNAAAWRGVLWAFHSRSAFVDEPDESKAVARVLPNPDHYTTIQIRGMNSKDAADTMPSTISFGQDILLPSHTNWQDAIMSRLTQLHARHHASCKVTLQTYPSLNWLQEIKLHDAVQLRIIILLPCKCFTSWTTLSISSQDTFRLITTHPIQ